MRKIFTIILTVFSCSLALAQSGEITGKVIDEEGEGIPFANVAIVEGGIPTGQGTTTDFDGNYSIKPLNPGKYDIMISYLGYKKRVETGVLVSSDKTTFIDAQLNPTETVIDEIEIIEYKVPLIDPGQTSTQSTVSQEEIDVLPTRSVQSIASTTSGVYQKDEGEGLNIKGGRENATEYYVDGIKVRGTTALPASAIEQMTVVTGGIPAKYGDATGGIINITTRGPSRKWEGGIEVVTSQYLDPYGYNLFSGNVAGPILKNKETGNTVLGFFVAAEYLREKDPDPSAIDVWVAKDDVLETLENEPIQWNTNRDGFILTAETITFDDIEKSKTKPNTVNNRGSLVAKLQLRASDNINITLGGNAVYRRYHDWVDGYTLMNSVNNPIIIEQTYRGFARFTHNLGRRAYDGGDEDASRSAIQNAYYTLQVDYEKYLQERGDDEHRGEIDDIFKYGYIGQFETRRAPVFAPGSQTVNGQTFTGVEMIGIQDTLVVFTPGDLNPLGTNYTSQFYNLIDGTERQPGFNEDIRQIQQNNALINGQRSGRPFDVWYNTGRQFGGARFRDRDQFTVNIEGAFDILKPGSSTRNKHSIEFGVRFEQRVDRQYSVNGLGIWERMRQLTNNQIQGLDTIPTLIIDGVPYAWNDPNRPAFGLVDTLVYDRLYEAENQSTFDKKLREALGLAVNGTEFIDIDNLDLAIFDVGLFSPDELWLDGAQQVFYWGYDHTGEKLKGQPSFNDFFTKEDENGELIRGIGAFRPIYTAAYIQDKFHFKDLTFNVGVRVDRYDANQKVLKDPYSLYEVRTVSEVDGSLNSSVGSHPTTIGNEYAVYVNDYQSSNPVIVGYRNEDQWYDAEGNELASGTVIQDAGLGGTIQPYLVNENYEKNQIKQSDGSYDPNSTFEDYNPQVTVMPRLQFSFNLTDRALFFAHYDILSQRPQSRILSTPDEWLFFSDAIGTFFSNPALKPEKTIDFQIGFRQRVSTTSAVTISGFYREFKDMVQVSQVNFAFPNNYNTFGNKDFGTAKGFSVDYDLRRTGNIRLTANYSIQFANGTGSDDASQLNLINANQPNLRTIAPLDFDARHTINLTFDYRYGSGTDYNGPVIKNSQILANSGVNLTFSGRSGTPYTQQSNATPEGFLSVPSRPITKGTINGSRLPWTFRMNGKVNKSFDFKVGGKKDGDDSDPRTLSLNVYLQVQNILNADNVTEVYRFTGNPEDDGYLTDPSGLQQINSTEDIRKQSFIDLYQAFINDPDHYSQPRSIRLGVQLGF